MKRLKFIALMLISTGSIFTAQAFGVERLVCRGGAGTIGLSTIDNSAMFYFSPSSDTLLQPGECALVNGGLPNGGVHKCIKQTGVRATAWLFPAGNKQAYISSPSPQRPWMRKLLNRNHFQYFDIIRNTNGCFIITRVY